MSLRRRIAIAAGLAVAVAVAAIAVGVYVAVRSELRGQVDTAIKDRAQELGSRGGGGPGGPPDGVVGPPGGRPFRRPIPRTDPGRFGGAEGFIQLLSPTGQATRPPGETAALPVDRAARRIARTGAGSAFADQHVGGTHLRVLTIGLGNGGGAIQTARPLNEVDSVLHRTLLILLLAVAAGIALAVALGGVVARTALAPIRRFTDRTEAISAELDPSERMSVEGDDELSRLAHSFNTTLDALEQAVESQRQLVADASHELRTPIASLRANIQVLEDAERLPEADRNALRQDIVEELDELTALVADVVELARGAKPQEALDDVRLDQLATALADRTQRRAGDAVQIERELEPAIVRGDPERIGRAISNLLDNAVKWSPPGGIVELRLRDGALTVRDHGPGFAGEDLPRVFERFYRAKDARGRPGSGLGLAIVRQAAETHGGSVSAANAGGGGALLTVSFGPAWAPSELETPVRA